MSVTAVLLGYLRPANIARLIDSLRTQTLPPKILLIDNSPSGLDLDVDRIVRIPWNAGCPIRTFMSFWSETDLIMWMDDDLRPDDPTFVARAIESQAKHCPTGILGIAGRRFELSPPHYGLPKTGRDIEDGKTAIVKGRFMLFRKEILASVRVLAWPVHSNMEYMRKCDDIYISLETGHGEAVHHIDGDLGQRIKEMGSGRRYGDCTEPNHFHLREKFCAEYIATGRLNRA